MCFIFKYHIGLFDYAEPRMLFCLRFWIGGLVLSGFQIEMRCIQRALMDSIGLPFRNENWHEFAGCWLNFRLVIKSIVSEEPLGDAQWKTF